MSAPQHIHYLRRQEIDLLKWDACIEAAPNGLIYGRSFYLDAMTAGQWDALVLEDYRAVMPLPWNEKFGFYYLYQPFCTPCLGIFGDDFHNLPVAGFLQAIPKKFKYWDIDLNDANFFSPGPAMPASPDSPISPHSKTANQPHADKSHTASSGPPISSLPGLKITSRLNHFLRLDKTGEGLEQDYNRLAKRMCKRAVSENFDLIRNIGPRDVIDLYRMEYGAKHPHIKAESYGRLMNCADTAFNKGHAQTYLALWPDDGGTAAFYLVLSDNRFVYSTLGGSTPKGKEASAFYLLTDAAIKDHAGTDRVFRFEGSDIPGIASFDASFGSVPVHYPHLLMNNLPFPLNLLK